MTVQATTTVTTTTTSLPTTTQTPATCPSNITKQVDYAGDKINVTWMMPVKGVMVPITTSMSVGGRSYRFQLRDGVECLLVITVTG